MCIFRVLTGNFDLNRVSISLECSFQIFSMGEMKVCTFIPFQESDDMHQIFFLSAHKKKKHRKFMH